MGRASEFRIGPSRYHKITLAAVAALAIIVVTGAAVRLTGSGLGCTDWPNCTDDRLVAPLEFHPMVEFVNRLFTGVVSVAVAAAVLGAYRRTPFRADLVRWSWGLVAGVVAQIVWGGLTVWSHLHPAVVSGHFLISMVLMWNAVTLAHRAGIADNAVGRPPLGDRSARVATLTAGWGAVALISGPLVTGTGPHAGDEEARRFVWNITTVARLHSAAMWIFLALVVASAVIVARDRGPGSTLAVARTTIVATVAQGAVGYVQYATGVPAALVALHVAGATIVWCLTVWLALSAREDRRPAVADGARITSRMEATT